MTQQVLPPLAITPTTFLAVIKQAKRKWNKTAKTPATVHEFLVNVQCYWDQQGYREWKASELAESLAELLRDGTPGYASKTDDELVALCFEQGIVRDYVDEGKTLAELLQDHPWIVWEDGLED